MCSSDLSLLNTIVFKAAAAMKTMVLSRDASAGLGWHRGPVNSYGLFVGDAWLASASGIPGRPQRWDTVADLYNKVRTTQPAYDVAGLSTQEYLDIVAYLLKQNGLPAGKEELKNDINLMRNMTLDKGFERLFNGKDFTGWDSSLVPTASPGRKDAATQHPAQRSRSKRERFSTQEARTVTCIR